MRFNFKFWQKKPAPTPWYKLGYIPFPNVESVSFVYDNWNRIVNLDCSGTVRIYRNTGGYLNELVAEIRLPK